MPLFSFDSATIAKNAWIGMGIADSNRLPTLHFPLPTLKLQHFQILIISQLSCSSVTTKYTKHQAYDSNTKTLILT